MSTIEMDRSRQQRTCKSTFARSTGAVTRVVGIADRKPAVASSGIDNSLFVLFGVAARMSSLDIS